MNKSDATQKSPGEAGAPRRGRPAKPNALTPAQRAKAYRERLKANPLKRFNLLLAQMDALKPAALAQLDAKRKPVKFATAEEWPWPGERAS